MALPEKPITRRETYLSNIAGQNTPLPEKPITREEAYLDYIAKNGGGGGTGEGDMKKVVYDSDLAVSNAGGIKAFVNNQISGKVDKVTGKGLSTNDFTNALKDKLTDLENIKSIGSGLNLDSSTGELIATGASITIDDEMSDTSINPVQNKVITEALDDKVDKVTGKGLSTEDYTTSDQTKLSGLADIKSIGAGLALNTTTGELSATGISITIDTEIDDTSTNPVQNKVIAEALEDKVDVISGKGLSTNDYTNADKAIVGGVTSALALKADKTEIPDSLDDLADDEYHRTVTDTEKSTWSGKADVSAIPTTTSELTNDSGFITNAVNNLVNYYLKSETYSQSEVDSLIAAAKNGRFIYVATLPTTDIDTKAIYLVPSSDPEAGNVKDEYINTDGTSSGWELIGSTAIDLSGYVQKSQTAGLLKNDGTVNTTIEGAVSANTSAITAIKDGTNIDSFGDVETALGNKQDTISDLSTIRSGATAGATAVQPSATAGLVKNDGTIDTVAKASQASVDAILNGTSIDSFGDVETALSAKQDTISDLSTIRSGASAGATAIQPSATTGLLKNDGTVDTVEKASQASVDAITDGTNIDSFSDVETALSGKQDTISDLSTIRSGASAGATAYQKPQTGIPSTDLASGVQTSLGKADSAIQSADLATVATSGSYTDLDDKPTIPDITGKADKVSNATNGNFAGLDANGNLTDSGSKASDFLTSADISGKQNKTLDTAITVDGVQQTTVEGALGAINTLAGDNKSSIGTINGLIPSTATTSNKLATASDLPTANPSASATAALTKLKVGSTVYSIDSEGSTVTIDSTGTASASTTSQQQLTIDGVSTDISGSKYMEQTINAQANTDTTFTFTNAAITYASVLDIFAGCKTADYEIPTLKSKTLSVSGGIGTLTLVYNVPTAYALTVRVYIRG